MLQSKLDNLPAVPGVYLLKDAQGKIIYIGKALSLRSRVRSYFQESRSLDPKTQRLHLIWTEKNGPAVRAPDNRSFGTRLVETLGKQFKGDVRLTYEPSGFVYAFDVPLASLTAISPGA